LTLFLSPNDLGPRMKEWWNYMTMFLLFFLVAAAVKDVREMKLIVLLMCLAVFAMDKSFWDTVSNRDYSTFSRDLQEGGSMGYAGVQGMAAFNAQYAWFLVALAGARQKVPIRLACLGLALFAANCVMYSFSRGGYVAFLAGWVFVGLAKERKLLVLLALFGITWASVVPPAVRDRVLMTYDPNSGAIDHSAEIRLQLWTDAVNLFQENPLTGTGFNTYAYMKRVGNYEDTHNIYLKVLVETGLVGLGFLLWFFAKTFRQGYRLFLRARDPFFSALGLGLAAWIVCTAVANLFGDRWSYFQISGYLWVLAGLVSKAMAIESRGKAASSAAIKRAPELAPA
jgi:O-antigen ligase